jgi:uncharacterized protein (TIGR03382 family)
MITGSNYFGVGTPGGSGWFNTIYTLTGYDNRTITTMGRLSGVISLVRPRLVHAYSPSAFPDEPMVSRSFLRIWQMDFHFLPEPGGTVMMAAGVVALAGLYRRRRRSVK